MDRMRTDGRRMEERGREVTGGDERGKMGGMEPRGQDEGKRQEAR